MGKLLSVNDMQEYLRIKRSKLYDLITKEGLKPTYYIGTSPRWSEESVISWLENKRHI
jgi:predicted DNA-binding transcriptional regulator AlpA